MKQTLLIFFVMTLCLVVPAQKKVTDREIEGLKGAAKSVVEEYLTVQDSNGKAGDKKRIKSAEYFFDKDGRQTQIIYLKNKLVYSVIDGFKTFKSYEIIKRETNQGLILSGIPLNEQKPIEEPEKLVPPDERFDYKYTYEYDSLNRIKIERQYGNNGRLYDKREFKYDGQGRVIEEIKNDRIANTKFIFKYDTKNNLIEQIEERVENSDGRRSKRRFTYNDYKTDAQGNWTQRKQTLYFEVNGVPNNFSSMYYRTIVYY